MSANDPICDIDVDQRTFVRSRFQPLSKHSFEPIRCRLLSTGADLRRRDFFRFAGGAAGAWPFVSGAQPSAVPVIGFLRNTPLPDSAQLLAAFRLGLSETGYAEGRNVTFEYRWAEGQTDRLPALAADLVGRATVIVAGGADAAIAAKAATAIIPIVFAVGDDPVEIGLVESLSRPPANVTGASFFSNKLSPKRVEILRDMVPKLSAVGYLRLPRYEAELKDVQTAAHALGLKLFTVSAGRDPDFEPAFAAFRKKSVGGLLVQGGAFYFGRRRALVELAARHAIPTIYNAREFTVAGGLMSYSASLPDSYRQAGVYTGRILGGASPTELPIVLPTKFELVINLKTAKALGLAISDKLLALADEVIE